MSFTDWRQTSFFATAVVSPHHELRDAFRAAWPDRVHVHGIVFVRRWIGRWFWIRCTRAFAAIFIKEFRSRRLNSGYSYNPGSLQDGDEELIRYFTWLAAEVPLPVEQASACHDGPRQVEACPTPKCFCSSHQAQTPIDP